MSALAGGAWLRGWRARPAGEPIPSDEVQDSTEGEESADVYPRRAVSPTQPWSPQPPARCVDAAVQTDVTAVAAWPSGLPLLPLPSWKAHRRRGRYPPGPSRRSPR